MKIERSSRTQSQPNQPSENLDRSESTPIGLEMKKPLDAASQESSAFFNTVRRYSFDDNGGGYMGL